MPAASKRRLTTAMVGTRERYVNWPAGERFKTKDSPGETASEVFFF
jgi:hypothetical protein